MPLSHNTDQHSNILRKTDQRISKATIQVTTLYKNASIRNSRYGNLHEKMILSYEGSVINGVIWMLDPALFFFDEEIEGTVTGFLKEGIISKKHPYCLYSL